MRPQVLTAPSLTLQNNQIGWWLLLQGCEVFIALKAHPSETKH